MATQIDVKSGYQDKIASVYDDLDVPWRLIFSEHADLSAAYFNGDYGKSLDQAQHDKHEWILKGIGFKRGCRILDIGCGIGPILKAVRDSGGEGVGLTLSPKQVEACRRHGLNAVLKDWKELKPGELGMFDSVVSLDAFEHFCSIEDYLEGKRDAIYGEFFRTCRDLLADGGKLYLQTMTWGENLPWDGRDPSAEDINRCSISAPYKSDERILALAQSFCPPFSLPRNLDYIEKMAKPYFELTSVSDGRLDYIKTYTEWEKTLHAQGWRMKLLLKWYLLKGGSFLAKVEGINENVIREGFIRDLFGHQRMFFKRLSKQK
ncbi:MAG: class I SAM-dependent methyltransferase [Nitrospinota bacterium]